MRLVTALVVPMLIGASAAFAVQPGDVVSRSLSGIWRFSRDNRP